MRHCNHLTPTCSFSSCNIITTWITIILQLQVCTSFILPSFSTFRTDATTFSRPFPSSSSNCAFTTPTPTPARKSLSSFSLNSDSSSNNESSSDTKIIRFLGKGKNAIVRPGVVLVAPIDEYQHYLMKSAIFIHAIGENEFGEHVTRGVIIDHPTPFTMGEMGGGSIQGVLAHNLLFRGGESGRDSAMLLHSCEHAGTIMIGSSGLYEGGVQEAMDAADDGLVDAENFKFFFNYMEFTDSELESMMCASGEEGDEWASVEVPPNVVLNSDVDRGEVWSNLRNQIQQLTN